MRAQKTTRRDFVKGLGLGAVGWALGGAWQGLTVQGATRQTHRFAAKGRERPNVLFLFTDDQAFSTLGALNNPDVRTPNMDRLVRRGTTFTHCFNQGAWHGAVCVASRAMLNCLRPWVPISSKAACAICSRRISVSSFSALMAASL